MNITQQAQDRAREVAKRSKVSLNDDGFVMTYDQLNSLIADTVEMVEAEFASTLRTLIERGNSDTAMNFIQEKSLSHTLDKQIEV